MEHERGENKRIYFGIFLIAIGAIWIFERLNLIPNILTDILISWQMLIIGIGVFTLIGGNKTLGYILILVGTFFLIPEIIYIPDEFRHIKWPILLIALGILLLFRHQNKREPPMYNGSRNNDFFDDFVIFGGREIFVNSQNFLGGRTTAIFGGSEYDLRKSQLSPNGAVIDCLSIFGGNGFKVPMDWTIRNEITPIFGGFSDKRANFLPTETDPSKVLIIKGFTIFGGIEIKAA